MRKPVIRYEENRVRSNASLNLLLQRLKPPAGWRSPGLAAVMVVFFGLLERAFLWRFYGPAYFGDSATYWRLANLIRESWSSYDGTRVPVYPYFLRLVGSDSTVYLLQLGMGLAITLGFFYIGWRITHNAWFAALAAMVHQLNLGQLFFEANILTETMATFWVLVALVAFVYGMDKPGRGRAWVSCLMGIVSALAVLTRPVFMILPPWLGLWMILTWQKEPWPQWKWGDLWPSFFAWMRFIGKSIRRQWLPLAAFFLPVLGLVLGWMAFIHTHYHDWTLSTMTGYHLVQHTGAFFEYVPDRYAGLRDVYLEYRDQRIEQYGTQTNTIWDAIPPMMQASGLTFYDLSRTLTRISIDLIRQHPDLFLRSVAQGWWLFWRAPVYWLPEALKIPAPLIGDVASLITVIVLIQRIVLFGVNLVFIIFPLLIPFLGRFYRSQNIQLEDSTRWIWSILLGLVWLSSFLQAILDHGDNPRFLIPLQSIITLWILWQITFGGLGKAAASWLKAFRVKFLRL